MKAFILPPPLHGCAFGVNFKSFSLKSTAAKQNVVG